MLFTPFDGITEPQDEYELLDSGEGEKLERFGTLVLRRPDPQALWQKRLPSKQWDEANIRFRDRSWDGRKNVPEGWAISLEGSRFALKLSQFKHVGIFPEQASNWRWIEERIRGCGKEVSLLNLFGYTGGATLAALRAGASVCHVDGSKTALAVARENARLSHLDSRPVRWILDDARSFAEKELRRGKRYAGIILDPPAFGHGPEGETWKIEEHLLPLLDTLALLLEGNPLFVVMNGYAAGYSPAAYAQAMEPLVKKFGGMIEAGMLGIRESGSERVLPAGITARFLGKI